MLVEEADERADRAGRVVVLRLAEQQRAAAFEVAQVDVVAERRADDAAAALTASTTSGSGLFHSDFGWMPTSAPVPTADIGCALVKISASGPMPDLEVLRPHPLRDQHVLQTPRFGRARARRAAGCRR